MTGALTITKKELKSYFYSPLAYVVLGVFLFIMGVIFAKFVQIYISNYMNQQRYGAQGITIDKVALYLYQNMAFFLILFTPVLTMKLFAEEKRQNTLELLFTVPIRVYELVLGKFIAAFCLMLVMLAVTLIYVFFMVLWGTPDLAIIGINYVGLMLSLTCYLAVGALISSLTASQALAAVFTYVALILLWLLQALGQGLTAKWGFIEWGPLLVYLSPLSHYTSFAEGLVHIKDVVYFVTFTAFFLFLTQRVVESNRWR